MVKEVNPGSTGAGAGNLMLFGNSEEDKWQESM